MPTYKHPCPYCDTFIERDVVACPACGRADPFAPARCPSCRTTIEDPSWVACPKCGTALEPAAKEAEPTATAATGAATGIGASAPSAGASAPAAATCTGCGAALPAGARFCRECGTVVA